MSATSSQAFCLKLNSHANHIIESFQKLYNDEAMVDSTLVCQGGTIKVHKLVLSACSPYFTSIFSQFTNPYQYPVVILKDMPFSDLKAIVEFMYRGEVTIQQTNLPNILEAAKTLMVTGLCDIKIANIETPAKQAAGSEAKIPPTRKSRKRRRKGYMKSSESPDEISGADGASDPSDVEQEDTEATEKSSHEADDDASGAAAGDNSLDVDDGNNKFVEGEGDPDADEECMDYDSSQMEGQPGSSGAHNLRSASQKMTPSAAMKANLRQIRIEKIQAITGGLSGRKMWSDEETRCLVTVWEDESTRIWNSDGKKVLSLKRISDLLQSEGIDRDISQVEGKIKALKRDYKAIKSDKAIPAVKARMAPYLDKLDSIFSREEF